MIGKTVSALLSIEAILIPAKPKPKDNCTRNERENDLYSHLYCHTSIGLMQQNLARRLDNLCGILANAVRAYRVPEQDLMAVPARYWQTWHSRVCHARALE